MIGTAHDVSNQFTDNELIALFDARGGEGLDHRGVYACGQKGDTATLPLRQHLRWVSDSRRMTLIEIVDAGRAKQEVGEYLKRKLVTASKSADCKTTGDQ